MNKHVEKQNRSSLAGEPSVCKHCGEPLSTGHARFCCHGCQAAWELIGAMGLGDYYRLADASSLAPIKETQPKGRDYSCYDTPTFQRSFVSATPDGHAVARVNLEGLNCYACVWLCEQLMLRHGARAQINFASGIALLYFDVTQKRLSELVSVLAQVGYKITPALGEPKAIAPADIVRLGVALFVLMNVMLLASADYFAGSDGIPKPLWTMFRYASALLTIPSAVYCAQPFYLTAWRQLCAKRGSIDQPITFGIAVAFVYSVVNTVRGHGAVYYDSVCAVVGLLLAGRFMQKLMLFHAERRLARLADPLAGFARRLNGASEELIPLETVKKGDLLCVRPGEEIPVASCVDDGESEVSLEKVTGEPVCQVASPGVNLPAGAFNCQGLLRCRAREDGTRSYWLRANRHLERLATQKGRYVEISDRLAGGFSFILALVAAGTLLLGTRLLGIEEASSRAIAVCLIACPCAFGLAAPLVFASASARALREGIAFRSQRSVERLGQVRRVCLDKTGTLTTSQLQVRRVIVDAKTLQSLGLSATDMRRLALSLGRVSNHQAARAIAVWAEGAEVEALTEVREVLGQGLTARWRHRDVALGKGTFIPGGSDRAGTHLAIDCRLVATFEIDEPLQEDAVAAVSSLKKQGLAVTLISGDAPARVHDVARAIGVNDSYGDVTPAGKALLIRRLRPETSLIAMVGNGANDTLAFGHATVSVAVADSAPSARDSADVCLLGPGLTPLVRAFALSRAVRHSMRTSFAFAGAYNLVGVALAISGYLTPGLAALLMPASSATIVYWASRCGR